MPSAATIPPAALLAPTPAWRVLDLAQITPRPGTTREQAAIALHRALEHADPESAHAQLLDAALRPRSRAQQRRQARPAPQRAVRHLIERGEPPYARAVAAELERQQERAQARAAQAARVAPLVPQEGPRAAVFITGRDRPILPGVLAKQLGWRWRDAKPLIAALVEAGWLTQCRRGGLLRLGPLASHPHQDLEAAMPPSRTSRERAQVVERGLADNRAGHDRARNRAAQQFPPSHGDPPRSHNTPNTNDGTRVAPR